MRQVTINIYSFDELSEESKEKAVGYLQNINFDYEWYDCIYEDAERIGLKLNGFNLDRHTIEGELVWSVGETAQSILKEHDKTCSTYNLAVNYYRCRRLKTGRYTCELFLASILQAYLEMLYEECAYQASEEAIIETIQGLEFKFTKDGKPYYS